MFLSAVARGRIEGRKSMMSWNLPKECYGTEQVDLCNDKKYRKLYRWERSTEGSSLCLRPILQDSHFHYSMVSSKLELLLQRYKCENIAISIEFAQTLQFAWLAHLGVHQLHACMLGLHSCTLVRRTMTNNRNWASGWSYGMLTEESTSCKSQCRLAYLLVQ